MLTTSRRPEIACAVEAISIVEVPFNVAEISIVEVPFRVGATRMRVMFSWLVRSIRQALKDGNALSLGDRSRKPSFMIRSGSSKQGASHVE